MERNEKTAQRKKLNRNCNDLVVNLPDFKVKSKNQLKLSKENSFWHTFPSSLMSTLLSWPLLNAPTYIYIWFNIIFIIYIIFKYYMKWFNKSRWKCFVKCFQFHTLYENLCFIFMMSLMSWKWFCISLNIFYLLFLMFHIMFWWL